MVQLFNANSLKARRQILPVTPEPLTKKFSDANVCLPFCTQTDYVGQVSLGNIDPVAIDNYNSMAQSNVLGDPK